MGHEIEDEDPAWRLTSWLLPAGAAASGLLAAAQTAAGGLDAPVGYPAAVVLAILAAFLVRDARRRDARRRWGRDEVYEYALPLGLLLATLALLAHGAGVVACAPPSLPCSPSPGNSPARRGSSACARCSRGRCPS